MAKKLRVGLLFPVIDSTDLILSSWKDLLNSCKSYNIDTITYAVGEIHKPETAFKDQNFVADLVNKDDLDGLIIYTGVLANLIGLEQFKLYCDKFKPLAMADMEPIPGNKFENAGYLGIRLAVRHLIEVHQCKKIAHVPGPPDMPEADFRLTAYLDELNDHGIVIDPELITPRNTWHEETGRASVKILLDRNKSFDAIVAANDSIAFGVIQGLRSRGIRIPEDVKLTGYDDFKEGKFGQPTLTSVEVKGFGNYAVEKLLIGLGHSVKQSMPHPILHVRNSCGCISELMHSIDGKIDDDENIFQDFEMYLAEMDGDLSDQFKDMIVHSLNQNDEEFFKFFKKNFDLFIEKNQDNNNWQKVISKLQNFICRHSDFKNMDQNNLLKLFGKLRVMVWEAESRRLLKNETDVVLNYQKYLSVSERLNSTFIIPELENIISGYFPDIGIPSCYISVFIETEEKAKLLIGFNKDGKINAGSFPSFESRNLVPSRIRLEGDYTVRGLFFENEILGFVVFETDGQSHFYDQLSNQLSTIIKSALLVVKMQEHTVELENAYDEISKNQEKLLITEKMASLGRLIAGIAHEMNTPLAAVLASLSEMNNLVMEYKESINNSEVLPEDHYAIAEDITKEINNSIKSIEKCTGFIRGIKGQTTGLNSRQHQPFYAANIVEDTLSLIEFRLRNGNCKMTVDVNDVTITGDQREFSQIIINLVNNAIDACEPDGGEIIVSLNEGEDGSVILRVEDSGCGIPPENLSSIFDPMFTTKPFGTGTGLGLTLVHDMVTKNNGKITVESTKGRTVFQIVFSNK